MPQQANVRIILTDAGGRNKVLGQYNAQPAGMYNQQYNLQALQQGKGYHQLRLVATDNYGQVVYSSNRPLVIQ